MNRTHPEEHIPANHELSPQFSRFSESVDPCSALFSPIKFDSHSSLFSPTFGSRSSLSPATRATGYLSSSNRFAAYHISSSNQTDRTCAWSK